MLRLRAGAASSRAPTCPAHVEKRHSLRVSQGEIMNQPLLTISRSRFRTLGGRLVGAGVPSRPALPLRRVPAAAARPLVPHVGQRHLGAALLIGSLERLQQQLAHLRLGRRGQGQGP